MPFKNQKARTDLFYKLSSNFQLGEIEDFIDTLWGDRSFFEMRKSRLYPHLEPALFDVDVTAREIFDLLISVFRRKRKIESLRPTKPSIEREMSLAIQAILDLKPGAEESC